MPSPIRRVFVLLISAFVTYVALQALFFLAQGRPTEAGGTGEMPIARRTGMRNPLNPVGDISRAGVDGFETTCPAAGQQSTKWLGWLDPQPAAAYWTEKFEWVKTFFTPIDRSEARARPEASWADDHAR